MYAVVSRLNMSWQARYYPWW